MGTISHVCVVNVLETLAHEVKPLVAAEIYSVLAHVCDTRNALEETRREYCNLADENAALRKQVAQGEGKYDALHDYCAVVEAERAELRGQLATKENVALNASVDADYWKGAALKARAERNELAGKCDKLEKVASDVVKAYASLILHWASGK
jgi:predicted nuclease with TOPRIM domain